MIDKVGGVENALKIAAIAAGAIWLALNASKIINFFTTIPGILKKAFSPSGLKTMGLVLLITTVILIVEDFINFMRGNDSVLGTIFDKLGINSDEVRETIVNSWSEIKDTLGVVWGWITDTAGKVSSTLSEFFQSDQGQGLLADAWTALMPVVEAAKKVIVAAIRLIGTIGQFVFSTLQTFWSQFGSTILSAAGSAFSGIMLALEGVLTFIQGVCDLVNAIITGDWSSAWSAFQQILTGAWQACVGIAQAALSTAIAVITAKFGLIWSTIQTYLSNIGSSVAEKMASVSEFIVNGLQKGIDFIKSLPAQALQWGADFIDGLINGIRNAAGKVADAVKGIADKVKSFLHFSRPDTGPLRDYEKWMPDFVGGLSKTLRQAKPKLTVAVSDVAAALKVNPTVQTMQKTVGINKAGNTVNQKVEISNTVTTSDRKSGQKASEMMEKSGEDITDAITKGLQFGRA